MTNQLLMLLVLLGGIGATRLFPTEEQLQDRFALGQRYYAANDHENGVRIFREIEETPNYALLNVDHIDVTIDELVLPLRVAATYQVGNSYRNVGRTRLSRSRNAAAEGDTALARQRRQEAASAFASAKEHYRRLVLSERAPLHLRAMAQYQVINADYQMESYHEVVQDAEDLLRLFPNTEYEESALYDLAWAYFHMGQYEDCIRTFQRLMEVSQDAVKLDRALFQTAESYLAVGQYAEAIAWYRRLVSRYDLAAMSQKELDAMKIQQLRGLVKETTRELVAKAQIRIGDSYAEQGLVDQAIAAYRLVSERYPQETVLVQESYDRMADMVFAQRGVDAGVRVLREAIERVDHPAFQAKAQLRIARALFDAQRYLESIEEFAVYVKAYGQIARAVGFPLDRVYFLIAEAHRKSGEQAAEGDVLSPRQNYLLAIEYYRKVIETDSLSLRVPESLYGLGHAYYGLGMADSAATYFAHTVAQYPSSPVAPYALIWVARLQFLEESFQAAASSYERLIKEYPDSELLDQAHKDLGLSCKRLGRIEDAVACFSEVSPSSPFWPKVQAEAGDMLVAAGRIDDAERLLDLDAAIRAATEQGDEETTSEIYYLKGRIAKARGSRVEEVQHFSEALRRTSNPQLAAFALFFRGLALYESGSSKDASGDSVAAVPYYERAVADLDSLLASEIPPKARPVAYRTRGVALTRLGRASEAVNNYRELIDAAFSPEEKSDFQLLLLELYYDQGQLERVVEIARQIIEAEFQDTDEAGFFKKERAYSVLSSAYLEQERYEDALAAASEGLARFPAATESGAMAFVVGRSLYLLEEFAKAVEAFASYIADYPGHDQVPSGYYYMGYCYEVLGEYDRAAASFRALADRFPAHPLVPDALYRVGENLYNDGEFEKAVEALQQVRSRFPASRFVPQALYSLSWTYLDLDQTEDFLKTMEQLAKGYPGTEYARYAQFTIADYQYSIKEYRAAKDAYQQVIEVYPGTKEAEKAEALLEDLDEELATQAYDVAFEEFQRGNYDVAARAFEALASEYPRTYSALAALANLGVALERLGDTKGARKAYERAIMLGPAEAGEDVVKFAELRLKSL